ncbi:hypothetical protein D3C76_1499580 [compost metagenome]
MRVRLMTQLQHLLRRVGVQKCRRGDVAVLLGGGECVELLLQSLQALVFVVALKVVAEQVLQCRLLLRQRAEPNAQWNVGAQLAEEGWTLERAYFRQVGGQGKNRFVALSIRRKAG